MAQERRGRERDELTVARSRAGDPLAARSAARETAWRLFEAGEFAAATAAFARAFAAGDNDPDLVTALHQLYIDAGDLPKVAALLADYLDRAGPDLPPAARAAWAARLFDAVAAAEPAAERRADAALQLLEAAAEAGEPGWDLVLEPDRHRAIEAAFTTPDARLDLLEQESYAPVATGLPARAVVMAEELGRHHAADATVARAAERLLHGLGAREAAYRVERARRAAAPSAAPDSPLGPEPPSLRDLVVVVAGGHAALRALVRRDLAAAGVGDVREIPPAWEAVRHIRDARAALGGADVAVLIGRRLPHSTIDQVVSAAKGLGVPVVRAETASASAVRRAVEGHAAASAS